MNRREFLGWVGVGGIASYLPIALAACSPKVAESESPTSPPRTDGFQSVGTVAELDKSGQIN
ncbi:MAG: cytochrome B6, partial [Coleofasciculus sp. S288]|nr:cytochrome B6 [Coleofasciculus sp. S288]